MISFENDYSEGAHPKILKALTETNFEQLSGYGNDVYTESAAAKIRAAFSVPDADVFFLLGGTQINSVIISSLLKPYEGVLSAETGHIASHEAGAIEFSGHKVITLPEHDGKLNAGEAEKYLESFYGDENREHMVFPGMIYISHPTEYGTLYTKSELEKLSAVCRRFNIPLYLDGARLGYALASPRTDVTAADIARLADVFCIGGTKVGALCGEAVVFSGTKAPDHFLTLIKQRGALLAKGRLLGIQFDTLFTDGIYFEISKNAIDKSERMKAIIKKYDIPFFLESPTNQQFIIIPDDKLKELAEHIKYSFWDKPDESRTVIRLATSWCTSDEALDDLDEAFEKIF